MSLPLQKEEFTEPDLHAIDTPAELLAENYKTLGMSVALARKLIADHGENAFGDVAGLATLAGIVTRVIPPELADGWRMTAFRIWQAPKARLSAGAFLMAVGWLPPGMKSQRDLAKYFKVSPEHVSNLVEEWQRELGLTRNAHQKSPAAVKAAKLHHQPNTKHHAGKK